MPSGPGRLTFSPAQTPPTTPQEAHALLPEATLQGRHYRLVERQEMRQWSLEVSETWWLAYDRESGSAVRICEAALPLVGTALHAFFRSAVRALLLSSTHPQVSALLNVFLEYGRGFFVFAHPDGESLQTRVQRRGLLSEQEAIDGYGQLANVLWFFSQQHPALVHGSLQPDHLVQVGSRWVLTHASPLVAGGVTQWIPALKTTRLAVQSTPAADLSTLSAVIYYAVIGRVPPQSMEEQQAQVIRATLSPPFAAVLLKGVHPRQQERYPSPSELLEAMGQRPARSDEEMRRRRRNASRPVSQQPMRSSIVQVQNHRTSVVPSPPLVELPRTVQHLQARRWFAPPEILPPIPPGRDRLMALGWTGVVLLAGAIILLVAR